jgi:hypothetical protein
MKHRSITTLRNIATLLLVTIPSVTIMIVHLGGCSSKERFTDSIDVKTGMSVSERKLATALKEELGDSWAPDLQLTTKWRRSVSRIGFFGQQTNPTVTVVAGNDSTVYFYRDTTNHNDGNDFRGSQESAICNAVRFFGPVDANCRAVFSESPFKWGIVAYAKGKHILPADDPASRITVVFRERPDSEPYHAAGLNEDLLSDDGGNSTVHAWSIAEQE